MAYFGSPRQSLNGSTKERKPRHDEVNKPRQTQGKMRQTKVKQGKPRQDKYIFVFLGMEGSRVGICGGRESYFICVFGKAKRGKEEVKDAIGNACFSFDRG